MRAAQVKRHNLQGRSVYKEAEERISAGLSLGARVLLGAVSALFGAVMVFIAPSMEKPIFIYCFGGFCIAIAAACTTTGRVRQFIGSVIGAVMFCVGLWYLGTEVSKGTWVSGSRAGPSALNAVLYLVFIGIPGATYAYRVRFGLRNF